MSATMATRAAVSWLRSSRSLLAGSALLDLVFRLPEDIITPGLSLASGLVGSPTVGFVTTWLMITVAFYTFAPLGYSHLDVLPRDTPGFRGIFAAGAIGLGLVIQWTDDLGILFGALFLDMLFLTGLFLTYFAIQRGWALLDPDGRAVDIIEFIVPHEDVRAEIESDLGYEGWLGIVAAGTYLLAVGVVLSVPVVIAAISTQVIIYSYPIPDLVFLGWAVSIRVLPELATGPGRQRVMDMEFDFERTLIDTIENATRSLQGMFSLVFIVLGLLLSANYLVIAVGIAPDVFDLLALGIGSLISHPSVVIGRLLWNMLGLAVLAVTAGCYGIWAWVRELSRLPHFLDAWEDRGTERDTDPVSRPPGLIAPAVLTWLPIIPFVHYDTQLVTTAFAVVWPLVVVFNLWTVRWTYQRPSQPVNAEHWWISGGLILQMWSVWLAPSLSGFVGSLHGSRPLLAMLGLPLGVTVLLMIIIMIPVISRYESKHDGVRRFLLVGLLFVLGIAAFVIRPFVPANFEISMLVLGGTGLVSSVLLGVVRFYEM